MIIMFENKPRYVSRRIHDELPIAIQILLWMYIDELATHKKLDYLQVFKLKWKNNTLIVIHSQEKPRYTQAYHITTEWTGERVSGKIYVIDDGSYCTMIWADEY